MEAVPASATPDVQPIGRAVKLEALPPPPLWRPRTRPRPTWRVRKAFLLFAAPFFLVTPGRFAPPFDTRLLLLPLLPLIPFGFYKEIRISCPLRAAWSGKLGDPATKPARS